MRFLKRSLLGLCLMALTFAILATAAFVMRNAVADRLADAGGPTGGRERVFAANVLALHMQDIAPQLTAYGEVRSTRRQEIRATTGGTLIELALQFQEGAYVTKGTVLARLDPAQARAARDQSQAALQEAQAGLEQAQRSLGITADDLQAAQRQVDLRQRALDRQVSLNDRGLGSAATTEEAELAASSAEQSVLTKRAALSSAQAAYDQGQATLLRAQIDLSEAERILSETQIVAGYDGYLSSVTAVSGGLVSANEMLAELIDPSALEVSFRVSTRQFSRFTDPQGQLVAAPVQVQLDTADGRVHSPARLERVGAAVEEGATGRLLFATMQDPAGFRPGDFVTVILTEPMLPQVARIPARAVNAQDQVLVLAEDTRLREAKVEVLRREGDQVIIRADLPSGTEIVAQRTPLLGEGIKLRAMRPGQVEAREPEPELELDPARRARLLAFVDQNTRMPEDAKQKLRQELTQTQVSRATVERLESRMGG
ncbi:hypothetical protein BFP70_03450 [Thioclava sp. SK-1]|uniref:efflux RND transporter periplasmic adaptor subunit n=1 Tax=Thioclava sp. SK-1 TaxID=1889770 RepID=UPI0008269058|nr:efflux RND transporter periplasmic adaptor subunit [Thioclava sp. SK-1]OCX66896.1 hypothetical protein BFP70_03450 [Thioclava sp. SK-1]